VREEKLTGKLQGLDLTPLLTRPRRADFVGVYKQREQDHGLEQALDNRLIEVCRPAIERGEIVRASFPIKNTNRTVGTMLGSEVTRRWKGQGLPPDTISLKFTGSCGQSFAAFLPRGITMEVEGDANDYFCKGLSGGSVAVYPPRQATFVPEENIIIGNVAGYGATSGEMFVRGLAGERFCVRNSGMHAVVEGVGDHGCEYMTGGVVVVLGPTGRNFAAGMSGGIAYVLDEFGAFDAVLNKEMVDRDPLELDEDVQLVQSLIRRHLDKTGSTRAGWVLENWESVQPKFAKIFPRDYKRVLAQRRAVKAERQLAEAAAT
jgi:glutamate synthase (ferredoxin)